MSRRSPSWSRSPPNATARGPNRSSPDRARRRSCRFWPALRPAARSARLSPPTADMPTPSGRPASGSRRRFACRARRPRGRRGREPEQPGRQDGRPRSPDRPPRVARGPGRLDDRRRGLRRFRRGREPRARSPGEGRCRPALVRQDLWARRAGSASPSPPRHSGAPARRPRPLGGQRPGPRDRRRGAGRFRPGLRRRPCGSRRIARGSTRCSPQTDGGRRRMRAFSSRGGQRRGKRVPAAARRGNLVLARSPTAPTRSVRHLRARRRIGAASPPRSTAKARCGASESSPLRIFEIAGFLPMAERSLVRIRGKRGITPRRGTIGGLFSSAHGRKGRMPARAPRVFTIPPGSPFLPTLSRALIDGALIDGFPGPGGPLALAEATIYVPTQRAASALADALLKASGRAACCCRASRRSARSSPTRSRPFPARARRSRPARGVRPAVGALTRRHTLALACPPLGRGLARRDPQRRRERAQVRRRRARAGRLDARPSLCARQRSRGADRRHDH